MASTDENIEARIVALEESVARISAKTSLREMMAWLTRSLEKYFVWTIVNDYAVKTSWFKELREQVDTLRDLHVLSHDRRHE